MQRKTVPVLNSLVFVCGSAVAGAPDIDGVGRIWRNSTGVAISCLPDSDGATDIVLSDSDLSCDSGLVCIFDGTIDTPSGELTVEILPDVTLFGMPVARATTRLHVWTDGFPDTRIVWLAVG